MSLTEKNSTAECHLCNDREFVLVHENGDWRAVPCQCKAQKAIKRMIKASGLTPEQRKIRLANLKPLPQTMAMHRTVQRYLEEFPKIYKEHVVAKGFALTGTVGTGKTTLAVAVANEMLERRIPTAFVVTPNLIGELREAQFEGGLEEKIHKLSTVDVCIFDDVAKEKVTEWIQTQYFRIIDNRYRNMLPTIFTSNFGFDEISERLGEAVASRLYAMTKGRQIHVEAEDLRVCL